MAHKDSKWWISVMCSFFIRDLFFLYWRFQEKDTKKNISVLLKTWRHCDKVNGRENELIDKWPTFKGLKTAYFLGRLLSVIQISCQMPQEHENDIKNDIWYDKSNFSLIKDAEKVISLKK